PRRGRVARELDTVGANTGTDALGDEGDRVGHPLMIATIVRSPRPLSTTADPRMGHRPATTLGPFAGVVKLADTQDLGSCALERAGSSPASRTTHFRTKSPCTEHPRPAHC